MALMIEAHSLLKHLEQEIGAKTNQLIEKRAEVAVRTAELREAEAEATLLEGALMEMRRMHGVVNRVAEGTQQSGPQKNAPSEGQ